jgi:hypothetical protein
MSALSFYTRPKYFCAHCGSATEEEIDIEVDSGGTRSIWCNNKPCQQYNKRARVQDAIYTMVADKLQAEPTDPTLALPLGSEPDDPNGRC